MRRSVLPSFLRSALRLFLVLPMLLALLMPGKGWGEEKKQEEKSTAGGRALEAARTLMASGRHEEALSLLRDESGPEADMACYLRGMALRRLGRHGEARMTLLPLSKREGAPLAAKARMLLAAIHLDRKEYGPAEALLAAEARSLLSDARKKALAGLYMEIVEKAVAPARSKELGGTNADWSKALRLLDNLAALELPADVMETVLRRRAELAMDAGRHDLALGHAREAMKRFDPWTVRRVLGVLPGQGGGVEKGAAVARLRLVAIEAACRMAGALPEGDALVESARPVEPWIHALLDDLFSLWSDGDLPRDADLEARASWLRPFVAGLSRPLGREGNEAAQARRAVALARRFVHDHPADGRCLALLRHVPPCLDRAGFAADALAAWDDLIDGEALRRLAVDEARKEALRNARAEALFGKARTLSGLDRPDEAQATYARYLREHPNGARWQQAQEGVLACRGALATRALAEKRWEDGRAELAAILSERGLAPQAGWIDLALALTWAMEARARAGDDGSAQATEEMTALWRKAESALRAVARRRPGAVAQEASFRRGEILRHRLDRLTEAVEAYRASGNGEARAALDALTRVELELVSPRVFRSDETPTLELRSRNVKELKLRAYRIDLADFFRKYHGTDGLDRLDLDLVQPDRSWTLSVTDARPHAETSTKIPVKTEGPGAWAVTVEGADHEATVLLLQSDLELVSVHGRDEVLVLVKDGRTERPVADAEVTVWAGTKKGETLELRSGADGVARGRFEDLPPSAPVLFVRSGANVAVAGASLPDRAVQSLSPRGYLYTSRPVYLPGETLQARAIIRELGRGSLVPVQDMPWLAQIVTPDGRILRSEERRCGAFGTFSFEAPIPAEAPLGTWSFRARTPDGKRTWSRPFEVRHVEPSKVWLELVPDRPAALAGDRVTVRVRAGYFTGLPLGGRPVLVTLPDGRSLRLETDGDGRASVEVDTSPFFRQDRLDLTAAVPGEDAHGSASIHLAPSALRLESLELPAAAHTGQSLEWRLRCVDLAAAPARAAKVRLDAFLEGEDDALPELPNRILAAAGLASSAPTARALWSTELEPDAEGRIGHVFTAKAKGALRLVARVADERGREFILRRGLTVTEAPSERFAFVDAPPTVTVGRPLELDLRNEDRGGLGLLVFTADRILSYRVELFRTGRSHMSLPVTHEHFPNFSLLALATGRDQLHRAEQSFRVLRRLDLRMTCPAGPFAPGEKASVEIEARDHNGEPVEAEFTLSLVDEGLLKSHPDRSEPLEAFFEAGLRRSASFTAASSVTFRRVGKKRALARAILDERRRLADRAKGQALRDDFARNELAMRRMRKRAMRAPSPAAAPVMQSLDGLLLAEEADETVMSQLAEGYAAKVGMAGSGRARGDFSGREAEKKKKEEAEAGASARELAIGAWWSGTLRTDARGRATVPVPMPARTTRYRLRARAVTPSTLLGETVGHAVVRRPVYVDCRIPAELMEGDAVRPLVTLHGIEKGTRRYAVTVEIRAGKETRRVLLPMDLKGPGSTSAVADPFVVPPCPGLEVEVTVRADERIVDRLVKSAAVRPWGVLERDGAMGELTDRKSITLRLPPTVRPASTRLELVLHPGLASALVADEGGDAPGLPSNHRATATRAWALLSLAHRLRGIPAGDGRVTRLNEAALACLASLGAAQASDGSWSWISTPGRVGWERDRSTTAWAAAAMVRARDAGLLADPAPLERALTWLDAQQGQGSHELDRLESLHALALAGKARFSVLNRLHRDRARLGRAQRALLGLAFLAAGKESYARTLAEGLAAPVTGSAARRRILAAKRGVVDDDDGLLAAAASLDLLSRLGQPGTTALVRELEGRVQSLGCRGAERWLALAALGLASPPEGPAAFRVHAEVNGVPLGVYEGRDGGEPGRFVLSGAALELPAQIVLRLEGRGRAAFRATLEGFSDRLTARQVFSWGPLRERHLHSPRLYKGRRLVDSQMEVERLAFDDAVEDGIDFSHRRRGKSLPGYVIVTRWIPAGARLDRSSLPPSAVQAERRGNELILVFRQRPGSFRLRYLPHCPGTYRCLPASMVDARTPWPVERLAEARRLEILAPGEPLAVPYRWSDGEHRAFGLAHFADDEWDRALAHLSKLDRGKRKSDRELIRALLWIRCRDPWYAAAEVVDLFEILEQRHPGVTLPYDKLLRIGQAYHDRGEDEAACYLWRATMESAWRDDVPVAAELEAAGEYMRAVAYLEDLFWIYPNLPVVMQSFYGLSQDLYAHKDRAAALGTPERPLVAEDLLRRAVALLRELLALDDGLPYADEATFSLLAALRDLGAHRSCLDEARSAARRFGKSKYVDRFRYLAALAAFQLGTYDAAIEAARLVADGKGPDAKYATYILGQMEQALGRPDAARATYRLVREDFPDAAQAIDYLERRSLDLPEVVRGRTGEEVTLALSYVGTEAVRVMAYRVDLMRLYLKEKNLDRIAGVKLAGITPTFTFERTLPPVAPGTTGETVLRLPIRETGAYLVLARSDEVFASSLALISPLSLEVQSYADALRVTVWEGEERKPAQDVHVKASNGVDFAAGETDLRGAATLSLDPGRGRTVVVRRGEDGYAFWRAPRRTEPSARRIRHRPGAVAFDANIRSANMMIQQRGAQNLRSFFGRRALAEQGVQASSVRK